MEETTKRKSKWWWRYLKRSLSICAVYFLYSFLYNYFNYDEEMQYLIVMPALALTIAAIIFEWNEKLG